MYTELETDCMIYVIEIISLEIKSALYILLTKSKNPE